MNELKFFNADFRVVLQFSRRYAAERGVKRTRYLVGRSGLINEVGEEMAIKMVRVAYRGKTPKVTCKLRRGLEVIFYLR